LEEGDKTLSAVFDFLRRRSKSEFTTDRLLLDRLLSLGLLLQLSLLILSQRPQPLPDGEASDDRGCCLRRRSIAENQLSRSRERYSTMVMLPHPVQPNFPIRGAKPPELSLKARKDLGDVSRDEREKQHGLGAKSEKLWSGG
jgi:hypothetical protein